MANIYKVGLTTNSVGQRIQELNSTGVPTSFELVKKYEIQDSKLLAVERRAHQKLKKKNFHHGKEFFKGHIEGIQIEVEDAIFELTGETAIELVGLALQRKFENERRIEEERQFEKIVQERLDYENSLIDRKRADYLKFKEAEKDENTPFLDKYLWLPLGILIFGALAIAIMTTGPLGWVVVGIAGWWIYNEDHVKPEQWRSKEAERKFPYKTREEIRTILKSSENKLNQKNGSNSDANKAVASSTKGFTLKDTVRFAASESHTSLSQKKTRGFVIKDEVRNPTSQSHSPKCLQSKSNVEQRVNDEILELVKRDAGLMLACYKVEKNLKLRNALYKEIRTGYLNKQVERLGYTYSDGIDNKTFDSLPSMTWEEISDEVLLKSINL